MKRRTFLKASAAGLATTALPAWARTPPPPGRPIVVVIYLRGGIDALNAVIPVKDPLYHKLRPTIAISQGAVPLDERWALHPALAALKPLWDAKLLAPVVNVGSPHPTRSHFDAQDFMEHAAPGLRHVKTGWLNRWLELTAKEFGRESELRALAMQGLLPTSLRGPYPVLAVPEGRGTETARVLDLFDDLYQGGGGMEAAPTRAPEDPVLASGQATIATLRRYRAIQDQATRDRTALRYPPGPFGSKLRGIAQVIKAGEGLQVACADYQGWDHHAGEGGAEGQMAGMLRHFAESLARFFEDLGAHRERTLVLVMSEFGRTCAENGNAGTDHGRGGVLLALGGPVRGGRVHGRWTGLAEKDLCEGRDLPVTTDFRDLLNEVLVRHLRFRVPRDFFPEYRPGKEPGLLA